MTPRRDRPVVAYLAKRSAWQAFFEEGKAEHAKRLVARGDPTAARLLTSHQAHQRTVDEVLEVFEALGVQAVPIAAKGKGITAARHALVVTIGGDGTLLRASHDVVDVPVLAINSAPSTSVGFFCGARSGEARERIARALEGRLARRTLTRMQVAINGKVVHRRILNDALFCHASPAATSRYLVELGRVAEEHKSSGFWIGPAAGSTAAQRSAGGRVLPLESKVLQFVARELYTPSGDALAMRRALVKPERAVVVRSKMHEASLFLDGPEEKLDVAYGDVVEFRRSDEPLTLLGISARRGRARW